jgi:glutathione reductase (NADPH)
MAPTGKHYDLIVVGGGSGGIAHSRRAAEYGVKAAIVVGGPIGGTCVNVGCVPKKVMWYTATQNEFLHDMKDYGYDVEFKGFDWKCVKRAAPSVFGRLGLASPCQPYCKPYQIRRCSTVKVKRDAYIERLHGIYNKNLGNSMCGDGGSHTARGSREPTCYSSH